MYPTINSLKSALTGLPGSRYIVALCAFGVAAALSVLIKVQAHEYSSSLFLIAVIISAWYGGLGPALLVTVVASVFKVFVLFDPVFSIAIGVPELIRLVSFGIAAVIISSLTTRTKAAEQTALKLNAELEQRVKVRTEELEKANRRLWSFCYSIAHDLRAPLRSIQGFADALCDEYGAHLDDTARDYTGRMKRSTQRMDRLISDLLTYSEMTTRDFEVIPTDLGQCVRHVVQEFEHPIAKANATIKVEYPLGNVLGSTPLIELIVRHLLDNALKFVSPGQPPSIRIWTDTIDSTVKLNIEDKGIGIDPQQHHQIFGIFQRLHGNDEYPGTGIGLAMVKVAAEKLKAEVGLNSSPGHGTNFWVSFKNPPAHTAQHGERIPEPVRLRPALT